MTRILSKFRAKDCSGNWVFGIPSLIKSPNGIILPSIMSFEAINVKVEPDTISQFSRHQDINGIDIYEGDVLLLTNSKGWSFQTFVYFFEGSPHVNYGSDETKRERSLGIVRENDSVKIIGNVYDEPFKSQFNIDFNNFGFSLSDILADVYKF